MKLFQSVVVGCLILTFWSAGCKKKEKVAPADGPKASEAIAGKWKHEEKGATITLEFSGDQLIWSKKEGGSGPSGKGTFSLKDDRTLEIPKLGAAFEEEVTIDSISDDKLVLSGGGTWRFAKTEFTRDGGRKVVAEKAEESKSLKPPSPITGSPKSDEKKFTGLTYDEALKLLEQMGEVGWVPISIKGSPAEGANNKFDLVWNQEPVADWSWVLNVRRFQYDEQKNDIEPKGYKQVDYSAWKGLDGDFVNAVWIKPVDGREVWIYDKGVFRHTKGKLWEEKSGDDTHHFMEVERTNDFIQLYNQSRDITIQLRADRSDVKWKDAKDFELLYKGEFKQQAKGGGKVSIVGVWETPKTQEFPFDIAVEFSNNGKMRLTIKADKQINVDSTYRVDGSKINITHTKGGNTSTDAWTIKELSDKQLVVIDDKGKTVTYTKK
jgi:uncharacterized protein (TIGR03066 family)